MISGLAVPRLTAGILVDGRFGMKRLIKNRILWRCISILLVLLLLPAGLTGLPAEAAVDPEIRSAEDMYDKIEDQISKREMTRTYRVSTLGVAKSLVKMDMEKFQAHYDEDDPLRSGCYLSYYIETIYLSYQGKAFTIRIKYPHSKKEMDQHFEYMNQLAVRLKGESDYDTIKNVHDYLIENFEYDNNTDMANHTDIDGFRDGVMVCSGYSLAAYYLLNVVGIKTRVITGYGGGDDTSAENHMWNMVQLEGKWYNMDITWDDGGGSSKQYTYFLKSDSDFPMHRRLGIYAAESFNLDIAEDSYPLPIYMKIRFDDPRVWTAIVVVLVLILMGISLKRRNKTAAIYHGEVLYEEDIYENVNERTYESWKRGDDHDV